MQITIIALIGQPSSKGEKCLVTLTDEHDGFISFETPDKYVSLPTRALLKAVKILAEK